MRTRILAAMSAVLAIVTVPASAEDSRAVLEARIRSHIIAPDVQRGFKGLLKVWSDHKGPVQIIDRRLIGGRIGGTASRTYDNCAPTAFNVTEQAAVPISLTASVTMTNTEDNAGDATFRVSVANEPTSANETMNYEISAPIASTEPKIVTASLEVQQTGPKENILPWYRGVFDFQQFVDRYSLTFSQKITYVGGAIIGGDVVEPLKMMLVSDDDRSLTATGAVIAESKGPPGNVVFHQAALTTAEREACTTHTLATTQKPNG